MPAATTTTAINASAVERTNPANTVHTPASHHFCSSTPTSAHAASATNSPSVYGMVNTIAIGAPAHSATKTSPTRPRIENPADAEQRARRRDPRAQGDNQRGRHSADRREPRHKGREAGI